MLVRLLFCEINKWKWKSESALTRMTTKAYHVSLVVRAKVNQLQAKGTGEIVRKWK